MLCSFTSLPVKESGFYSLVIVTLGPGTSRGADRSYIFCAVRPLKALYKTHTNYTWANASCVQALGVPRNQSKAFHRNLDFCMEGEDFQSSPSRNQRDDQLLFYIYFNLSFKQRVAILFSPHNELNRFIHQVC